MQRGGNCYAYSVLTASYISMHNLQHPGLPVDYSAHTAVLQGYDQASKLDLSENQFVIVDDHIDSKPILDERIAIFNENTNSLKMLLDFSEFSESLFANLEEFKNPFFCFLSFFDHVKCVLGQALNHSVLFYFPSPHEMHFFDSISGLHIVELPKSYTQSDLKENIIELVFKKNPIMKWLADENSKTLFCNYNNSYIKPEELVGDKKIIQTFLQAFAKDQTLTCPDTLPVQYKKFVERSMFVIKMQNTKQNNSLSKQKLLVGVSVFLALYYQTENVLLSGVGTLSTLSTLYCMTKIASNIANQSNTKEEKALGFSHGHLGRRCR